MLRLGYGKSVILVSIVLLAMLFTENVQAQTGWYPRVIAPPAQREIIKNTPIHLRPNRPLHFYGNSVRRQYYRENPAPNPSSIPVLEPSGPIRVTNSGLPKTRDRMTASSILLAPELSRSRDVGSRQLPSRNLNRAPIESSATESVVVPRETIIRSSGSNRSNSRRIRLFRRR